MWEYNSKDPWIRIILLIISSLLVFSLVLLTLNLLFGGQGNMLNYHYSMMYGYNAAPNSILAVFAKLLLLVSSMSFIISLAVYFAKNTAGFHRSQKPEYESEVINIKACDNCGFIIHKDWKCCPKCGTDLEKHETLIESTVSDVINEDEVVKEQNEQVFVEPEEKDDIVERLYQTDSNKTKKNNKKNQKNS